MNQNRFYLFIFIFLILRKKYLVQKDCSNLLKIQELIILYKFQTIYKLGKIYLLMKI